MARYQINGGRHLFGELTMPGAKNSALPILAASLLPEGASRISDVPSLTDVFYTCDILEGLGCRVQKDGSTVAVDSAGMTGCTIPPELMGQMRSSIIFLGAVLAKKGRALLAKPGGCALGARPIDLHLEALRRMGAIITESGDTIDCSAPGGLHGADIRLPLPSVGATENALIAASTAKGGTLIHNAAREPEVADLAAYLASCGAEISAPAPGIYKVEGVPKLHGCEHRVIPDRIAAVTYMAAAAAAGGELFLKNVEPEHIGAVLAVFERMGCEAEAFESSLYFRAGARPRAFGNVETEPFPGFPTDAGAILTAAAAAAEGVSAISERIFENRFHHIPELVKLGADIGLEGGTARIDGVRELYGAAVSAKDLRGGAALVVAGLAARGETTVDGVRYIERGYEDLPARLKALGADIELIV